MALNMINNTWFSLNNVYEVPKNPKTAVATLAKDNSRSLLFHVV